MSKTLKDEVIDTLKSAVNQCHALQRDDGSWSGEVHSNVTCTAEWIFLRCQLGLDFDPDEAAALILWLTSYQNADGSWGSAPTCPGDVSISIEAYLALKILGVPITDARMAAAKGVIIGLGGLPKCRMFTRVCLASFGLIPWAAIPALPVELIMVPSFVPINIYNICSWARVTCVPLSLVRHHEPLYALPNGLGATKDNPYLNELWDGSIEPDLSYAMPYWDLWHQGDVIRMLFKAGDAVLSVLGRHFTSPIRSIARRQAVQWILDHQEDPGDWAGIWPPVQFSILALSLEGYSLDHPVMRKALANIDKALIRDARGLRLQTTLSQVWDTALMSTALADSWSAVDDGSSKGPMSRETLDWIISRQALDDSGDWRMLRPNLEPGGWCFQDGCTQVPDTDDTCAVILALLKSDPAHLKSAAVLRAINWLLGMQSRDSGWGAFDADNDKLFLNKIPFSDMDALCDPSWPCVTGRILESWGLVLWLQPGGQHSIDDVDPALGQRIENSARRAIGYLLRQQESSTGAWWGRWGSNYIYGTSNVLNGLAHFHRTGAAGERLRAAVQRAVSWVLSCQNEDGGWGETLESYRDATLAGKGASTAVQTAWALMALLHYIPPSSRAIERGVRWLVEKRCDAGGSGPRSTWAAGPEYTAVGFPNHMWLDYDYYRHYWPVMALGRYVGSAKSAEKQSTPGYWYLSSHIEMKEQAVSK